MSNRQAEFPPDDYQSTQQPEWEPPPIGDRPSPAQAVRDVVAAQQQPTSVISQAEVDMQVRTAKAYPRQLARVLDNARSMATIDEEMAEQCIYTYSRGGKDISGPSVRLAEIIATCWGNLRCETTTGEAQARHIDATATVWDMEANVLFRTTTRRSIVSSSGGRYTDDMIAVTSNAAASIALRNAIFRVVPQVYVKAVYRDARALVVGDMQSLAERRQRALETFARMGIAEDRVLHRLKIDDALSITLDHLETLTGLKTSLKDGADKETVFPPVPVASDGGE
jgi:hypothetical protein